MKAERRSPQHGDWFVEDQTRTDNGFLLMRYCARLPYVGWHHYEHFATREEAIRGQVKYANGFPGGLAFPKSGEWPSISVA